MEQVIHEHMPCLYIYQRGFLKKRWQRWQNQFPCHFPCDFWKMHVDNALTRRWQALTVDFDNSIPHKTGTTDGILIKYCIHEDYVVSRDWPRNRVEKWSYRIRGIERELPQTVSKARPAVTMATAWYSRGIRVDESERGKHGEMTSYLDKLAGKQLNKLDDENTGKKLNKFQYQTVQ